MTQPGLWAHDLMVSFSGSRDPLLSELSAYAPSGTLTALVGPNGSGKTTLLRCLLGLHRPAQGTVTLDETPIQAYSERSRARKIAYVPQHPSLTFAHRLREMVALGCWPAGVPFSEAESEIEAWELEDLAEQPWNELSGGERQRGLLARACTQLHHHGRALLVDEPTASMDPRWAHRALNRLRQKSRDQDLAVIAVLHDLELAARYADRIWLLAQGSLLAEGSASETLNPEHLRIAYGLPFSVVEVEPGVSIPVARPTD